MSLYVSIDESYSVFKLNGLNAVLKECAPYTLQDGRRLTKALVKKEIEDGYLNLYDYDEDQLIEATEKGCVHSIEWTIKIQAI